MENFLKNLYNLIGGIGIGFGGGMTIGKIVLLEESYYWLITALAFVLGGFFLALGITTKPSQKIEKEKPEEAKITEEKESRGIQDI